MHPSSGELLSCCLFRHPRRLHPGPKGFPGPFCLGDRSPASQLDQSGSAITQGLLIPDRMGLVTGSPAEPTRFLGALST